MDDTFHSLTGRVDPSWWPVEIRTALLSGAVASSARHWCVQWWHDLFAVPEEIETSLSSLHIWARSENQLFFQIAESLGLCVYREDIRRIIDKQRVEALRSVLGAERVNRLIAEFPSLPLGQPGLELPKKIDAHFLRHCQILGLQLGLACAQQRAPALKSLFEVSLPLAKNDLPTMTEQNQLLLVSVVEFLVRRYGAQ